MDIERKTVIENGEVKYLVEYLSLILDDDCDIIDKRYPKEVGYKVYGHVKSLVEQLKKCEG